MDINYELYKVFYYVAKTLSFSEASKNCLFPSPQSVSRSKPLKRSWNSPFLSVIRSG